jgi:hypothetical protein
VDYDPPESTSGLFGGNSNWRGPIWFPLNFLIVEALERYHHFYGDSLKVEVPHRLGKRHDASRRRPRAVVADCRRYSSRTTPGADRRTGTMRATGTIRTGEILVLFYEYFHGETGRVPAHRTKRVDRHRRELRRGSGENARKWLFLRVRHIRDDVKGK